MKNISIGRTNLSSKYAGMLIGEKTDFDDLQTINESHRGINESNIEKNIPDIRIGSLQNKENVEGRHSEYYGEMLHSIVKKHHGEFPINILCNKKFNHLL